MIHDPDGHFTDTREGTLGKTDSLMLSYGHSSNDSGGSVLKPLLSFVFIFFNIGVIEKICRFFFLTSN